MSNENGGKTGKGKTLPSHMGLVQCNQYYRAQLLGHCLKGSLEKKNPDKKVHLSAVFPPG